VLPEWISELMSECCARFLQHLIANCLLAHISILVAGNFNANRYE